MHPTSNVDKTIDIYEYWALGLFSKVERMGHKRTTTP